MHCLADTAATVAEARGRWQRDFVGSMPEVVWTANWIGGIAADNRLDKNTVFKLQLCAEELLTNIVRHGGTSDLRVHVSLRLFDNTIELTIEDDGQRFDLTSKAPRKIDCPLEMTEAGGLGLLLIQRFSDGLTYERKGHWNCVTSAFDLPKVLDPAA